MPEGFASYCIHVVRKLLKPENQEVSRPKWTHLIFSVQLSENEQKQQDFHLVICRCSAIYLVVLMWFLQNTH